MSKIKKWGKKVVGFLFVFLLAFLLGDFSWISEDNSGICGNAVHAEEEGSNLAVHFLDVGQGDATLFICDGEAMLLDAGGTTSGTEIQLYLMKNGVEKLKYLILTHPDEEHIGGADVIITKYDIENVFMPAYEKDTKAYEEVIGALAYRWYPWSTPVVGSTYTLGNAVFTVVAPNRSYTEANDSSIGILLSHGNNKFLFTGDAEEEAEIDLVNNGINLDCNVYKAGHHGSKTSSSLALLAASTPDYVVVSCGENNSYGHPHAEPMNNFRSLGMKLFRTDEQGTIVAVSDGINLGWNMAPTESWKAGEPMGTGSDSTVQSPLAPGMVPQDINEGNVSADTPRGLPLAEGAFAVNGRNGKIHIVGACSATGNGKQAMKQPEYFTTFEEAESYSIQFHPEQTKRKCGNCWK